MAVVRKPSVSRILDLQEQEARQRFIDAAAIAIYATGFPASHVYERAAQLWELRQEFLRRGRAKP